MTTFLPDTSCMIAVLCSWHELHGRAVAELDRRLNDGETMIIAAHALVETYAVLTRLRPPHRLAPVEVVTLLEASFSSGRTVVSLDNAEYRTLLKQVASSGVAGGSVYDAVIAACAKKERATQIVTFNARHFQSVAGPDLEVVVP